MERGKILGKILMWVFFAVVGAGAFTARWFAAGYTGGVFGVYDSCLVAGVIVLLIGGLVLLSWAGAFEMLSYGTRSIIEHMNPSGPRKKYRDYNEYLEARRESRRINKPYFWPYVTIGGALLVAALILYFVYRSTLSA